MGHGTSRTPHRLHYPGARRAGCAALRQLRAQSGLTYDELAVRTGLSAATLKGAASGRTVPSWETLTAACGGAPQARSCSCGSGGRWSHCPIRMTRIAVPRGAAGVPWSGQSLRRSPVNSIPSRRSPLLRFGGRK
ncbi:helix-turn-helix transcriptional regulator [Streptomyces sp. NRRL S-87]|uniref:helix-turn-helix domain-containing protein n=1 Tax=Streptomyces sp. NRRL S-87 TaxID=1463920 RepID=UPI00099CB3F8